MFPRPVTGRARRELGRIALPLTIFAFTALALTAAGCGPGGQPAASGSASPASATSCGQAKTAANVPVIVEVARGQITCGTALTIMRDYAADIRLGLAPGNGGGGPLKVHGWTCEGFDTPTVLKTGNVSKCDRGGDEILAVLPAA